MKLLGIDEAGRGSVIGPLVLCGVAIEQDRLKFLERLGLKDSKKVAPKKRVVLARKIKKIAECHLVKITAKDIDLLRSKDINLNQIEKIGMNKIISAAKPNTCLVDSMDVKPERLSFELEEFNPGIRIIAEHKADDRYPLVAASSIVAKVERDLEIHRIRNKYQDIGSGYPSDPRTIKFLNETSYEDLPDFVRHSWATVEKLKG
ncbi:MAG TPA: ribonuclease HII [Methanobacteriaceae archaeon]|nr:ribonuclease HII [Methanobacteriaceae archaeon]